MPAQTRVLSKEEAASMSEGEKVRLAWDNETGEAFYVSPDGWKPVPIL